MSSIFKEISQEESKLKESSLKFPLSPKPTQKDNNSREKLMGVKAAIVFAFLLSVVALAGAGFIYQELNAERRQREALEATQVEFKDAATRLETESSQYRSEIARISEQLKNYVIERERTAKSLEKSQIEISNLQKKIKFLDEKNKMIEGQTVQIPSQGPPASLPAPKDVRVVPVAAVKPVTVKAVASIPPAVQVAAPPQVLTVNRKYNFVVVNVGLRDNTKIGDKLAVERDGKTIATVQVEKLYENFSAANISEESKNAPIKEKDRVRNTSSTLS